MTIEYKDSKRIVGLSTDFTTPIVWQNMTDGQTASGNVLSKSGANWTADATSTATFSSSVGAKVEFTVSANSSDSFCGFDISTNTDSYDMDYALYCGGGGTINIYANGSQVTATGVSYSTADTLAVNMDSSGTVTFLKNGSVFYTSTTTASGTYRVNAVIYTSGVSLTANYITDKPTDVQDNSILVEKDTARRYWGTDKVTTEAVYTYTTTQSTNEKLSGTAQAYSAERAGVELVSSIFAGKYIKTGKWNLKRVGTLGSNAFMKVEDSSGTVKGTSTGVAASGIGTSAYEDVTFTLPTAVELANGDRVYVQYTGADGSGNYLAFGEKHPSTTPTGWEFTIYNKHNSSGGSPSGAWGDDGLPTALVPVATFDSAPASNVTSDSITWTWEKEDIRGLFMGGDTGSASNVIDYITIATTGNATDFGDLVVATYDLGACSSHSRGVYGGGNTGSMTNNMGYVTIATAGNATDFGNLTVARGEAVPTASNRTRGIWAGGWNGSANVNTIDYVTIDTTGNAIDFGDLSAARRAHAGSGNSGTRGIFAGGYVSSFVNTIDYVTIAANPTVTATTFGTLSSGRGQLTGLSNTTRTLFAGGGSYSDVIDYYTNDTGGSATDFGNLTASLDQVGTCSSTTRGVMGGGSTGSFSNVIQYVTIATPSNADDFGDLTVARGQQCNGASGK